MIPIERRISDDTRLIDLTVGELKELMGALIVKQEDNEVKSSSKNLVYGIKGISELFKCSANTAMRLKNDVISKAVFSSGEKNSCRCGYGFNAFQQSQVIRSLIMAVGKLALAMAEEQEARKLVSSLEEELSNDIGNFYEKVAKLNCARIDHARKLDLLRRKVMKARGNADRLRL